MLNPSRPSPGLLKVYSLTAGLSLALGLLIGFAL